MLNTLCRVYKIPYKSIAVLTPYTAQKECIEKLVNKLPIDGKRPRVASIAETQGNFYRFNIDYKITFIGDEYDIVILSTVRSLPQKDICNRDYIQPDRKWFNDNLGFLTDPHLFNVGITRAKHGLIILGKLAMIKFSTTQETVTQIII